MNGDHNGRPGADYSAESGQAFLEEARIVERWKGCERFVVLDTHFNGGMSFLKTWSAWRADQERPRQLHYLAIESCPCSASALAEALAWLPEQSSERSSLSQELAAELIAELTAAWPTPVPGFHRLILDDEQVLLTLIFGEIEYCLPQIDAQVDAFYLNQGGANRYPHPHMSSRFKLLGRLAAPMAMLAVERGSLIDKSAISNSGFVLEEQSHGNIARFAPRWPQPGLRSAAPDERHAIVIGAGLAGSAAVERLAARGWRISLIERHDRAAGEASGNHAGIFMPFLTKDDHPGARLSRAAFLFSLHSWQRLGGIGRVFSGEACGVLQLARDAGHAAAAQEIARSGNFPPEFAQWLGAAAVLDLIGATTSPDAGLRYLGGWFFPQGGWANPGEVCEALLSAAGDKVVKYFLTEAARLERIGGQWHVFDDYGALIAQAPHVVLANGVGARTLSQTGGLPLQGVRGQVTYLPAETLPPLSLILCGEGYVTRPFKGICVAGASYDSDNDSHLRNASQRENLARLDRILPDNSTMHANLPLAGRVGFRCVSPDRLPLVGAIPDLAAMAHRRRERLRDVPRIPGLHGLLGYASRGLIWSAFAAELLAAQIAGDPLPIERELADMLDPARFCLRASRRAGK